MYEYGVVARHCIKPKKSLCTWLGECYRQVEAEEESNSRNQIHQTTYKDFFGALYRAMKLVLTLNRMNSSPTVSQPRASLVPHLCMGIFHFLCFWQMQSLKFASLFVHGKLVLGLLHGEARSVFVVEILDELLLQGLQAPERIHCMIFLLQ